MPKKNTVTMTFHIDPDLKREVSDIAEDFGLSLTAVTRAFYKQIVREGAIPLSFRYEARGVERPGELIGSQGGAPAAKSAAPANVSEEKI